MTKRKEFGWFRSGGFEKDPFLTEEDKKWYRKRKEEREWSEKRSKDDWL